MRQCECELRANSALADAAFAGEDQYHIFDICEFLADFVKCRVFFLRFAT